MFSFGAAATAARPRRTPAHQSACREQPFERRGSGPRLCWNRSGRRGRAMAPTRGGIHGVLLGCLQVDGERRAAGRGSATGRAGRLEQQEAADAARGPERRGLVERGIDDGGCFCRRYCGSGRSHVGRRTNTLLVRLTTKMKVTHDKAPSHRRASRTDARKLTEKVSDENDGDREEGSRLPRRQMVHAVCTPARSAGEPALEGRMCHARRGTRLVTDPTGTVHARGSEMKISGLLHRGIWTSTLGMPSCNAKEAVLPLCCVFGVAATHQGVRGLRKRSMASASFAASRRLNSAPERNSMMHCGDWIGQINLMSASAFAHRA